MMDEDDKPSPDEILKSIQVEEDKSKQGRLKVFFGMSAGVGKTYCMLQAAKEKLAEGVNLVIGTINTHGRKETEALLEGLPIIQEKWIKYKDTVFEEMDLQTLLDLRPELVLIDELAHTNVPGSKHPKRWQDVIELLDVGIDVYTTLNVQHLESRKDIVESITGIQVRETVPDLILERAEYIELIDIPPDDLLQRLKEGKVYFGKQSKIAVENFFQPDNLTALRQIALRFTAEKVDHELKGFLRGKGRKSRERIMAAITPSNTSEEVIRAARRFAFELDAPWIAVYVDTGNKLSDENQISLNHNMTLARDLGAEVITTHDIDIAAGLERCIKKKDITKIIIGRTSGTLLTNFFKLSLAQRLEKNVRHCEIIITGHEKTAPEKPSSYFGFEFTSRWLHYGFAIASTLITTLIGLIISPSLGYKSVGYIYLLTILLLSLVVNRGPILVGTILSAFLWDFVFIPPFGTLYITDPEDAILVLLYFIVALILGAITTRMREQDRFLHKREETLERLYEIEREITNSSNFHFLEINVSSRLERLFPGKFNIFIKGSDDQLMLEIPQRIENKEKEKASAIWTYQKGKMSGWSTDTLPSSEGLYIPVKFSTETVGVLAYYPVRTIPLSTDEVNFLVSVAQELGIFLERCIVEDKRGKQEYTRQVERIQQSIFQSLNRSFYKPIDDLMEINKKIMEKSAGTEIYLLTRQFERYSSTLKFIIKNMITIAELESGFVHFNKKQTSIKTLIDQSLKDLAEFTDIHRVKSEIPSRQFYFSFDLKLLTLALDNVILNALENSDESFPVRIGFDVDEKEFRLSIFDEGPGIPENILPQIFDKFFCSSEYRQGLGIGLSIVKAIIDIHQGKIEVENRKTGGIKMTLILPIG